MTDERWRCDCSGPDAATCTSTNTFMDRAPDGSCACRCHGEYSEDPWNWQPMTLIGKGITDAELRDSDDWMVRMDQAEALAEDEQL